MPTRFFSDVEMERLESFPETIEAADLARHFCLDGDDLEFVRRQHNGAGQLGIALQMCALRWLGFIPDDLPSAPAEAVAALAGVLDAPPRAIFDYSVRSQTRREHRPLVREHAGFRAASEPELEPVRDWLIERALEHERPSLLFAEACRELRRRHIERPGVNRVMRTVAWARERAHERTFELLTPQLAPALRQVLDELLVPDPAAGGRTRQAWLRDRPATVGARALRRELDKRAFLLAQIGADRFDLSGLPPNRQAWLAQTGRQSSNQAIARLAPERRYPVLMCFCAEALERATDDALEVFDRALGAADRSAQRKRDELRRHHSRDTHETVLRFVDLARIVLEAHDEHADVLRLVDRRIGLERLRGELDSAQRIARPQGDGHLDLLIDGAGATGRKLLAAVIATIEFKRTGADDDELLAALLMIAEISGTARRWLPGFSPSAFIDQQWRAHVVDAARGRLDRRAYELCAAYELRSALRAGRVWVPGSRRHADPTSYLLPNEQWQAARTTFASTVERPLHAVDRLAELATEQASLLTQLSEARDLDAEARLQEGELIAETSVEDDTRRLGKLIEQRLPQIDLPELLIEVDGWASFTDHLVPLSGNRSRSPDIPCVLYAAIISQRRTSG